MAIEKTKKDELIFMASPTILECNIASSKLIVLLNHGFGI